MRTLLALQLVLLTLLLASCGASFEVTETSRNMFRWEEEPYGNAYANINAPYGGLGLNWYLGGDDEHLYFITMEQSEEKKHIYNPVLVQTKRSLAATKKVDLKPYSGRMHLEGLAYRDNRHISGGGKALGFLVDAVAANTGFTNTNGGQGIDLNKLDDTMFVDAVYAHGWVHVFYRFFDKDADENKLFVRTLDTETMEVGPEKLLGVYSGIKRNSWLNTYRIRLTPDSSRIIVNTGIRSKRKRDEEPTPIKTVVYTSNMGFKMLEHQYDGFQRFTTRKESKYLRDGAMPIFTSSGNYMAYSYIEVAKRKDRKDANNRNFLVYDIVDKQTQTFELELPDESNTDRNFGDTESKKDKRKQKKTKRKLEKADKKADKNEESNFFHTLSVLANTTDDDKLEYYFYGIPTRVKGLLGRKAEFTDRMYVGRYIIDPETGKKEVKYYGYPTNYFDLPDINKDLVKRTYGSGMIQYMNLFDLKKNPDGSIYLFGQVSYILEVKDKKGNNQGDIYYAGDIHVIKIQGDELIFWKTIPKYNQNPIYLDRDCHISYENGGITIYSITQAGPYKAILKRKKTKTFKLMGKVPNIATKGLGIVKNTVNPDGVVAPPQVIGGLPERAKFYPLLGYTEELSNGKLLLPALSLYSNKNGLIAKKKLNVNVPGYFKDLYKTYGYMSLPR